MAIDISTIGSIYDSLEGKAVGTLTTLFEEHNITGEQKAQALSSVLNSLISSSVSGAITQTMNDKNIDILEREMLIKEAQSVKDLAVKDAQISQSTKQGLYIDAQAVALGEQVIDNRRVKALDSLATTYGTFGAGGLTLSTDMWTAYFDVVNDLLSSGGTDVITVTDTTVTKL